jgi:hypothetical protein
MNHLDSLEKFLNENPEDFILDTNSIKVEWNGMDMLEYLYECCRPTNIDNDFLEEVLSTISGYRKILSMPNVYIIDEVREETRTMHKKFSESCRWHGKKASGERSGSKISLMNEINKEIFELVNEMKKNEIRPHGEFYKSILDCIKIISDEYEKSITHYRRTFLGHGRRKPKTAEYFGTDEKIIATAFHRSITEDREVSVITNDGILGKKLKLAYTLIACPELYYGLAKLQRNPMKVYRINMQNEIRFMKNMMRVHPEKFGLYKLSPEKNKELKYELDNILYRGQMENDPHARD